jgi:hypothetical protein
MFYVLFFMFILCFILYFNQYQCLFHLTTCTEDYQHNFRGNVDDMFSLGITMKNDATLSISADNLYHSDIIIASPVALRLLIGSPGYVIFICIEYFGILKSNYMSIN